MKNQRTGGNFYKKEKKILILFLLIYLYIYLHGLYLFIFSSYNAHSRATKSTRCIFLE